MFEQQVTGGRDARSHEEEGRRGYIRRYVDGNALQCMSAFEAHAPCLPLQGIAHAGQHAFGVIARRRRFGDAGPATGIQTGQ